MTNFDRWLNYTKHLSSPQNYIEWSWRFTIGAALQRRVWIGNPNMNPAEEYQPCFANSYTILVGPPGTGKGLVLREVAYFLKYWKLKDALKITLDGDAKTLEAAELVQQEDLKKAQEYEMQAKNKQVQAAEPLLIPIAADATTYEALVEAVSQSLRRCNYITKDSEGKPRLGIYGHSTLSFVLQELASLLRKRTDDTVNYMLGLYDCPLDYEYNTKTQGKDRVRRGCLNLVAGTTPSFMESIFDEKLVDYGLASRTFFIFAAKNRKNQMFIKPLDESQIEDRRLLLDHIRKLTPLYGPVKITKETQEYLEAWWNDFNNNFDKRANRSPKLVPFYARYNIHVMKVAMMEHFSESTDMEIPLATFKRAISILESEEKNMHMAITMESKNPTANMAKRILEILKDGPKDAVELAVDTFSLGNQQMMEEAIEFLKETKQLDMDVKEDATTGEIEIKYKLSKTNEPPTS